MSQGRRGQVPGLRVTGTELISNREPVGAFKMETNDPSGVSGQCTGGGCRVSGAGGLGEEQRLSLGDLEKGNVLWRKKRDGSERPSGNCTVFSKRCQNGMPEVQVMSTPEKPYPPGRSISHKGRPSLTGPAQELGATITRQWDSQGSRFTNENSAAVGAKTWAPGAVTRCS